MRLLTVYGRFPFFVQLTSVFAILMLFPGLVARVFGEIDAYQAFLRTSLFILLVSIIIGVLTQAQEGRGQVRHNLFSVVLIYAFLPFILALPIQQFYEPWSFWDASFEMFSAFTTTGATLLENTFGETRIVLIYTAMVAWVGGLVFLLIAFTLFEPLALGGFEMLGAQDSALGPYSRSPNYKRHLNVLGPAYLILTVILTFGLMAGGDRSLYALVYAWSIMSTSGITPMFMGNAVLMHASGEGVVFFFLFLAISRKFLTIARHRDLRGARITHDPELYTALILLLVFIFIYLVVGILPRGGLDAFSRLRLLWGGIFTGLSFLTTNGMMSRNFAFLHDVNEIGVVLLFGLAIIGGGVATTAGGIKLLRVYTMSRLLVREMRVSLEPHALVPSGQIGRDIKKGSGVSAFLFFMFFLAVASMAALLFSLMGYSFEASLISAFAALSNCGPLLKLLPEYMPGLSETSSIFRGVFVILMIVGRLEIYIMIAIFTPHFWRRI